ncbi:MAG TPA: hypothetical protein VGF98_04975 [Candidatus Tumulicola sp.]
MMSQLAAATARTNTVLDAHTAKVGKATAALEAYRLKSLQLGTAFSGSAFTLGVAITAYGVRGAAEMQRSLTGVGIALHSSSQASMNRYAKLAFRTSGITAQDVGTIASEMAMAATSGLNDPKKLESAFTRIAKAADVLWMSPKHIDPVEAVKDMSQLAHMFGVYSGAPLQHMIDRSAQMMFVQPEALSALVTQGRMFISTGLGHGVSEDDLFKQAMTMGQTGFLRGRGGAGLANVIEYLSGAASVTGHLSKAQHRAMHTLGLTDNNGMLKKAFLGPHGEQLLGKIEDHLESIRSKFGMSDFGNLLINAFLKQGGRYEETALLPAVYKKSQENFQRMNEIGGVDKMWDQYRHNFLYEWGIFTTNLQNVAKAAFWPTLDNDAKIVEKLGSDLGDLVSYLAEHPDAAKKWANGFMIVTGLFGARTLIGVGSFIASAWKMPGAVTAMATSLDVLTKNIVVNAAILRGESIGGTILGPDGRVISRVAPFAGTALREGEEAVQLGKVARTLAVLDVVTMAVTGMSVSTLGIGAVAIAPLALLFGAYLNAREASGDSPHAKALSARLNWAAAGSNSGMSPPNTGQQVDIFGRPIYDRANLQRYMKAPVSQQIRDGRRLHGQAVVYHIEHITIQNNDSSKSPLDVLRQIESDPRSINARSGNYRTNARIPMVQTVPPR